MTTVAVVGGGNAGLCAALSARENGATVTVYERAPYEFRGGNSRFTGGAIRTAYSGVDQLKELIPDLTDDEIRSTDFGSYSEKQFFEDLLRVTQFKTDADLADCLVTNSFDTLKWLRSKGVRFLPLYGRQSFEVESRQVFWGGLTVEAWGGGPGLVDSLVKACEANGVAIRYASRVTDINFDKQSKTWYVTSDESRPYSAVILASGGFEANTEWRTRYLGVDWDLAKVRGTRFNTGDGIRMAIQAGARSYGHWSGCHAVAWDLNAPEYGDLNVGDGFQKHSYPYGIMVNSEGNRFVDEGYDFRNYTYAKYGREILRQPGQFAWQIFDGKTIALLRDEYRIDQASRVTASSLNSLASKLESVNPTNFLATVRSYNESICEDNDFNPAIKDGRATQGLAIPKSNWATSIDSPPFEAYAVTCGITFTFGGVRVNNRAQILDEADHPIDRLYAAGEMIGGLFYFNYPGGSGLCAGSVFGRIAGRNAATDAPN